MADINYLLLVILIMTAATYTTRLAPFVLFASHKETPIANFYCKKYTSNGDDNTFDIYVARC